MISGKTSIIGLLSHIFILRAACGQFYMKVDTLERCIIDSFEKDTEVILRVKLYETLFNPEYELAISIKDIDHRYYEAQRFKIINEKSRNIIYTHLASTEAFICFQANKEVYVVIEVDTNVKPPENLIKSDDIHGLENMIYQSVKEFTDFTAQNTVLTNKEDKSYEVS